MNDFHNHNDHGECIHTNPVSPVIRSTFNYIDKEGGVGTRLTVNKKRKCKVIRNRANRKIFKAMPVMKYGNKV